MPASEGSSQYGQLSLVREAAYAGLADVAESAFAENANDNYGSMADELPDIPATVDLAYATGADKPAEPDEQAERESVSVRESSQRKSAQEDELV